MKYLVSVLILIFCLFIGEYAISSGSDNKRDAEKYCEEQYAKGKKCKVSKWVGCFKDWTKDKRFNKHSGKDWFACKPTEYKTGTENNYKKCEIFRKKVIQKADTNFSPTNLFCNAYKTCKVNVTNVKDYKTFSGEGKDYYLCVADYKLVHVKCADWCITNRKKCVKCQSRNKGCPSGSTMTKFFSENYGACVR